MSNVAPVPAPIDQNNNFVPGLTTNLRCTLPPIFAATDNLRQFYQGSALPQYRVFPVQPLNK